MFILFSTKALCSYLLVGEFLEGKDCLIHLFSFLPQVCHEVK